LLRHFFSFCFLYIFFDCNNFIFFVFSFFSLWDLEIELWPLTWIGFSLLRVHFKLINNLFCVKWLELLFLHKYMLFLFNVIVVLNFFKSLVIFYFFNFIMNFLLYKRSILLFLLLFQVFFAWIFLDNS